MPLKFGQSAKPIPDFEKINAEKAKAAKLAEKEKKKEQTIQRNKEKNIQSRLKFGEAKAGSLSSIDKKSIKSKVSTLSSMPFLAENLGDKISEISKIGKTFNPHALFDLTFLPSNLNPAKIRLEKNYNRCGIRYFTDMRDYFSKIDDESKLPEGIDKEGWVLFWFESRMNQEDIITIVSESSERLREVLEGKIWEIVPFYHLNDLRDEILRRAKKEREEDKEKWRMRLEEEEEREREVERGIEELREMRVEDESEKEGEYEKEIEDEEIKSSGEDKIEENGIEQNESSLQTSQTSSEMIFHPNPIPSQTLINMFNSKSNKSSKKISKLKF